MVARLVTVTVGGTPRVIDLLRAPSNLPARGVFAVAGDGDARVFWDETLTPGVERTVTASTGPAATGTSSPITVPGLTNGTPVTFTVAVSGGPASWAADAVTPTADDAGVIYYVDSTGGSNSNAGTSSAAPLATLAAAMAKTLGPGDAVLLKRGSTWTRETFGSPAVSGAENRPITIGAYGTGDRPYLYAGETVTAWETYETQATSPELLANAAMETFNVSGAQTVPVSWHGFVGSGGGSISKATSPVDTGSTGSTKMTFGGGTNLLDQTVTVSADVEYAWVSRIATDSGGATAGVTVRLMVRCGETGAFRYLLADGSWTGTETYAFTHTPGASFGTKTITFTPENTGPAYVEFRSVPSSFSGQAVFIDNCSIKSTSAAPNSPNTYRCPLTRSSGSYPGMLYRDRVHRARGLDKDRLVDEAWLYDGSYLYYRQDAGDPAEDGAVYEVPSTADGIFVNGRSDWVVRDLAFHLYNRSAASSNGGCERLAWAENEGRQIGCQTFYAGVPANGNGVFALGMTADGIIRGNDVRGCHTDLFYGVNVQNMSVIDNVGSLATGDAGDCLQIDHGGSSGPTVDPNAFDVYVARNRFDQRGSPTPKGCIIIFANGGTIEDNVCYGGHFGVSVPGLDLEVRRNEIHEVGVEDHAVWAAGIYSENNGGSTSGANIHHNLIVGCENGINLASGQRSGYEVAHNTIVASVRKGIETSVTWSASEIRDNLLWNPDATDGEGLPSATTGLTVTNNLAGVDPLFVDQIGYVPGPGSPALDAATDGGNIGAV